MMVHAHDGRCDPDTRRAHCNGGTACMSCYETLIDYGLRSVGIGERLLPRTDFTLCQQFTLIGSGMIWNIYFGALALISGFFLATALALGKNAQRCWLRKPAEWFIFVFRGSPLFIQFFLAYFLFLSLKQHSPGLRSADLGRRLARWSCCS